MTITGFRLPLVLVLVAVVVVGGAACSSTSTARTTSTQVQLIATGTPPDRATADPELDTELSAPTEGAEDSPVDVLTSSVLLPSPALTPGDVFPVGTGEICVSGYSSRVRSVSTSTKNAVYAEYHVVSHTTGQYEVDHLIPLELGGSNDIKNLWPEPANPRPGFHEKDTLENKLHALVCAGSVDLATAQHAIAGNWYVAYVQYVRGGVAPPPASTAPAAPPPQAPAPAPPAASGVTFASVIGAPPGGVATAAIQTLGGAACSIGYVTPAGTRSTAQGLITKTAGADGTVSWSWNIGPSTRPGTGTVTVTCGGASASAPITIG